MATLSDLLRFKKQIEIKHPTTQKVLSQPWIRILGDEDLKEAYRWARIASAAKRAAVKDKNSTDSKDARAQLSETSREDLFYLMRAARENAFVSEATAIVVRPDLPKIDEIAAIPDAPTLEEQEIQDKREAETEESYQKALREYVETKLAELEVELNNLSEDDLYSRASLELINVQAMEAFNNELNDQKAYRGTYNDEACKNRAFSSIEDFKETHTLIKEQIIAAYSELEMGADDLKN